MNTSLSVAPGMLASVQGLWRWFTAAPVLSRPILSDTSHQTSDTRVNSVTNISRCGTVSRCAVSESPVGRPVRVIRVLEASQAPAQAGRMVMSGRMADVCAELDRLAAREAALH